MTGAEVNNAQHHMRIVGLDSLRGMAALIVVFKHFQILGFDTFNQSDWVRFTPMQWLICGRMSVILFFVLSGFVLSVPIFSGKTQAYSLFLIRRFARIYLPFLFSILLAAALWWGVITLYPTRDFEFNEWKHDITWVSFLSHIFATGIEGSNYLNSPVWTLVVELRVAIIFPLLAWLVYKKPFVSVIASVVLAYAASKLFKQVEIGDNMYYAETIIGSLLLTLYYIQFFVFGIFIAAKINWIKSLMMRIPEKVHYVLIAAMFLVPKVTFDGRFIIHEMWYAGMASYLVICCVLYASMNEHLMAAPLQWLGKVSFSLYLVHTPLILALIYVLLPYFPIWGILIISFPLILVSAELMNRYIEMPCMQLGKKWTTPKSADKVLSKAS